MMLDEPYIMKGTFAGLTFLDAMKILEKAFRCVRAFVRITSASAGMITR